VGEGGAPANAAAALFLSRAPRVRTIRHFRMATNWATQTTCGSCEGHEGAVWLRLHHFLHASTPTAAASGSLTLGTTTTSFISSSFVLICACRTLVDPDLKTELSWSRESGFAQPF